MNDDSGITMIFITIFVLIFIIISMNYYTEMIEERDNEILSLCKTDKYVEVNNTIYCIQGHKQFRLE